MRQKQGRRATMNATNPYEAPKSRVADYSPQRRYYSAWQICVPALLGGPPAAGCLASRDHELFGSSTKARNTLVAAALLVAVGLEVGRLAPKNTSYTVPAAMTAALYRQYAEVVFREAIAQHKEQAWVPDSWWRVLGISLASLVLLLAIGFLGLLVFPPRRH